MRRKQADKPGLNHLERPWCTLNRNPSFLISENRSEVCGFSIHTSVWKDGPLIFVLYVVAVAFLARIQPLTSHQVSPLAESYCSLL